MPVWRLTPIDLADPDWAASSHRAVTVVRAPDEESARQAAQEAFGVKTRFPPGEGVTFPPWTREELVRAERIEDPRYPEDGATAVLDPSFDRDLAG